MRHAFKLLESTSFDWEQPNIVAPSKRLEQARRFENEVFITWGSLGAFCDKLQVAAVNRAGSANGLGRTV